MITVPPSVHSVLDGPSPSPSPARQLRKESRRKVEQARANQQQTDSDSDLDNTIENYHPDPRIPINSPPPPQQNSSDDDHKCKMSLVEKMAFFSRQKPSGESGKPNRFHDRKRRFERARTQPITEEDVAHATEQSRIARSKSEGPQTETNIQRQFDRARSVGKEPGEKSTSSEEDELSR